MTSSGGSSPTSRVAPPRKRFVLAGRSVRLDPSRYAVRGDLADLDLADQIFAPHYARARRYRANAEAVIRAAPDNASEPRGSLAPGDPFHVLDLSGGWLWGRGEQEGSVGYVPADAVSPK